MKAIIILALAAGVSLSMLLSGIKPGPAGSTAGGGSGAGLAAFPGRIVCTSPALTEIFFDIGQGSRLIAVSRFTTFPKEALKLPRIGGHFNPDFERILALQPDFLLSQGRDLKLRDFAKGHSIRILQKPLKLDDLQDLYVAYARVGELTGVPLAAAKRSCEIQEALAKIRERAIHRSRKPKVFIALGHGEKGIAGVYTCTDRSFLGQVVELAGGDNVFAHESLPFPAVSIESLEMAKPDIIIDLRPGAKINGRIVGDWRRCLPSIPAVETGRVYVLTQDFLCLPGPRVKETAALFERLFFQEEKNETRR